VRVLLFGATGMIGHGRLAEAASIDVRPTPLLPPWMAPMTRVAAALMVLIAVSPLIAAGQSVGAPRAQLTTGTVQGLALPSGVSSFRGIP
jgi:negative regulator of sigma E activity